MEEKKEREMRQIDFLRAFICFQLYIYICGIRFNNLTIYLAINSLSLVLFFYYLYSSIRLFAKFFKKNLSMYVDLKQIDV